jgi:hypothetical protein
MLPLLKFEWMGCVGDRPVDAVKGRARPAPRTLDGNRRTRQSSTLIAVIEMSQSIWLVEELQAVDLPRGYGRD